MDVTSLFDRGPAPTVLKYYLYWAVGGPGFIYPIYVLYLLSHGVTFAQIGTIAAVQSVVVIAGEIPTGYVGDRIGRRNSLVIGQLLFVASALGLIFGRGFLEFTVAFALLSFGQTFVSGSGDAWLYDILRERLDEEMYTHVRGRGGAIGQWVTALTMVGGGFLYVVGHLLPFVAVLVMRVVTLLVVLTLPKNAQYADDGADAAGGPTVLEALPVVRDRLTQPPLRSFVAYMALFLAAALTVDVFIQPITRNALRANAGAVLSSLGLGAPEAATLGLLYASFTVTSAVASDRASDVKAALGVRTALLVVPFLTGLLLVVPAVVPAVAFPMFFAVKGATSVLRPISGQYINDRVESLGRATVLSAVSMVYAVARIPFAVGSGVVADAFSPLVAVAALGGAFLLGGSALFLFWPPVERGAGARSPEGATSD